MSIYMSFLLFLKGWTETYTKIAKLQLAVAKAQLDMVRLPDPIPLGSKTVTEGNPDHKHKLELVEWDRDRFGFYLIDMDKDPGGKFATPMGTWHELFRCSCGQEIISSERALI